MKLTWDIISAFSWEPVQETRSGKQDNAMNKHEGPMRLAKTQISNVLYSTIMKIKVFITRKMNSGINC